MPGLNLLRRRPWAEPPGPAAALGPGRAGRSDRRARHARAPQSPRPRRHALQITLPRVARVGEPDERAQPPQEGAGRARAGGRRARHDGRIVPARHGRGLLGWLLGPVSGCFLAHPGEPSLLVTSDAVLTDALLDAVDRLRPDVILAPAGSANMGHGGDTVDELVTLVRRAPGRVVSITWRRWTTAPRRGPGCVRAWKPKACSTRWQSPPTARKWFSRQRPPASLPWSTGRGASRASRVGDGAPRVIAAGAPGLCCRGPGACVRAELRSAFASWHPWCVDAR